MTKKWKNRVVVLLVLNLFVWGSVLAIIVGMQKPEQHEQRIIICTNYQPEYILPGIPQKVGLYCFDEVEF